MAPKGEVPKAVSVLQGKPTAFDKATTGSSSNSSSSSSTFSGGSDPHDQVTQFIAQGGSGQYNSGQIASIQANAQNAGETDAINQILAKQSVASINNQLKAGARTDRLQAEVVAQALAQPYGVGGYVAGAGLAGGLTGTSSKSGITRAIDPTILDASLQSGFRKQQQAAFIRENPTSLRGSGGTPFNSDNPYMVAAEAGMIRSLGGIPTKENIPLDFLGRLKLASEYQQSLDPITKAFEVSGGRPGIDTNSEQIMQGGFITRPSVGALVDTKTGRRYETAGSELQLTSKPTSFSERVGFITEQEGSGILTKPLAIFGAATSIFGEKVENLNIALAPVFTGGTSNQYLDFSKAKVDAQGKVSVPKTSEPLYLTAAALPFRLSYQTGNLIERGGIALFENKYSQNNPFEDFVPFTARKAGLGVVAAAQIFKLPAEKPIQSTIALVSGGVFGLTSAALETGAGIGVESSLLKLGVGSLKAASTAAITLRAAKGLEVAGGVVLGVPYAKSVMREFDMAAKTSTPEIDTARVLGKELGYLALFSAGKAGFESFKFVNNQKIRNVVAEGRFEDALQVTRNARTPSEYFPGSFRRTTRVETVDGKKGIRLGDTSSDKVFYEDKDLNKYFEIQRENTNVAVDAYIKGAKQLKAIEPAQELRLSEREATKNPIDAKQESMLGISEKFIRANKQYFTTSGTGSTRGQPGMAQSKFTDLDLYVKGLNVNAGADLFVENLQSFGFKDIKTTTGLSLPGENGAPELRSDFLSRFIGELFPSQQAAQVTVGGKTPFTIEFHSEALRASAPFYDTTRFTPSGTPVISFYEQLGGKIQGSAKLYRSAKDVPAVIEMFKIANERFSIATPSFVPYELGAGTFEFGSILATQGQFNSLSGLSGELAPKAPTSAPKNAPWLAVYPISRLEANKPSNWVTNFDALRERIAAEEAETPSVYSTRGSTPSPTSQSRIGTNSMIVIPSRTSVDELPAEFFSILPPTPRASVASIRPALSQKTSQVRSQSSQLSLVSPSAFFSRTVSRAPSATPSFTSSSLLSLPSVTSVVPSVSEAFSLSVPPSIPTPTTGLIGGIFGGGFGPAKRARGKQGRKPGVTYKPSLTAELYNIRGQESPNALIRPISKGFSFKKAKKSIFSL